MGLDNFMVDSDEKIVVISTKDSSIDRERTTAEALERYSKTRDLSLISFKQGASPVEFVIRALDDHEERRLNARAFGNADANEKISAVFMTMLAEAYDAACVELRNVRKPGDSVEPSEVKLSGQIRREIGAHILEISGVVGDGSTEARDDVGK